jgi:hypothetical protein
MGLIGAIEPIHAESLTALCEWRITGWDFRGRITFAVGHAAAVE